DWTGRRSLRLDPTTWLLVGEAEKELNRLKSKFAPGAIVTLGACSVAKGEFGQYLLRRVSSALGGVIVQGGEHSQSIAYVLKGPVIRCQGDTCWVAQTGKETVGLRY